MKFQEIFNNREYPVMRENARDCLTPSPFECDFGDLQYTWQVNALCNILTIAFIAMGPDEIAKYPQLGLAMGELEKMQVLRAKDLEEDQEESAQTEPVKRDSDGSNLAFDILALANQSVSEEVVNRDLVVVQTAMLFQKFVMGNMSRSEIASIAESRAAQKSE